MATDIDWRKPDYTEIIVERARHLAFIRADPAVRVVKHLTHYRQRPEDFIDDWGWTVDPRNIEVGQRAEVPFRLWPKQREWVRWAHERWLARERGLTDKSRDVGLTWLAVALSCTLCVLHKGMAIGFGSRKEEYVDKLGDPKSILWKARNFCANLPTEFRGGYSAATSPHMQVRFPATGSIITGEAGDGIGRGDRTSLYFVDEAAFLQRPQLIEQSLSATTNCRIDLSTANGMGNPFAQRRFGGKTKVFTLHWRDDPRRDAAWYERMRQTTDDLTVAREYDISYTASAAGVLIPAAWVQASIDADRKLGFECRGARIGALDVADEGPDANAYAGRRGVRLESVEEWLGKGADLYATAERAMMLADGADHLRYDADGMGAGIRGDARIINQGRPASRRLRVIPYRSSGAVVDPDSPIPTADPKPPAYGATREQPRLNRDYFANHGAQAGWELRMRFQRTYRAVEAGRLGDYDPDDLIVIAGDIPDLALVCQELSQPTYGQTGAGKLVLDKQPAGTRSPNRFDAIRIAYAPMPRIGYTIEDMEAALK